MNPQERMNTNLLQQQLNTFADYQMLMEKETTKEVEANFVVDGALMICDQGKQVGGLRIEESDQKISGKFQAHIKHQEEENFAVKFGTCEKLKEEAGLLKSLFTNSDQCCPDLEDEWQEGKEDTLVGDEPALLETSCILCKHGGKIELISDGQSLSIDDINPEMLKMDSMALGAGLALGGGKAALGGIGGIKALLGGITLAAAAKVALPFLLVAGVGIIVYSAAKSDKKVDDMGDADIKDLDKLPKGKIDDLGGEDYTQGTKSKSGKSKSDLYWDKDGNVFSVPKNGGPPQWVDWIPRN